MTDTDNERGADADDSGNKESGSRKVIYAAVLANLGIAVAKFIVAAITGSAAMLAEGIHSAVDTGNEFLLLIGERNSAKPADKSHPFGYGKALYFWALLVALSVFSLGGGLSIYHGISALRHPDPVEDPLWNYVVLAVSACFEGYSWNVSRRELNKRRKPGASLWQTVHASKDASVFTVFIEDTAALLGLAIAAVGITLGWLFDSPYFDAGASVMIGLLLVGAAFALARETGALLVGEGIGTDATRRVCQILRDDPSIEDVGKVLSMQLGPDDVLLTAAVRFNRGMRIDEVEAAIERLETAVAAAYPPIRHIYFESGALRSAMR
ncbi:cation diffusion facilitator family transporter [Massilia sp. TW-1]|uniref:Cation diffusion facilitator family transporter n=1 Tax=Telluria antibiotica TaxID=2717319 RepID=A0ABX0P7Y0_9BURK|nr:cation diffusion facilitator family transporter [Telluria antibiotica]NIA52784.1 cation diffusion facilitator family transporter [Telluria antibiotica]